MCGACFCDGPSPLPTGHRLSDIASAANLSGSKMGARRAMPTHSREVPMPKTHSLSSGSEGSAEAIVTLKAAMAIPSLAPRRLHHEGANGPDAKVSQRLVPDPAVPPTEPGDCRRQSLARPTTEKRLTIPGHASLHRAFALREPAGRSRARQEPCAMTAVSRVNLEKQASSTSRARKALCAVWHVGPRRWTTSITLGSFEP